MRAKHMCVPLVTLLVGGLLAGCSSSSLMHGGKLGPRYGVQAGYVLPVGGNEQEYAGNAIAGASFRVGADLARPVGFELGIAYSALYGDDASVQLLFWRARGLYSVGVGGLCLQVGLQLVQQWPEEYGERQDQYDGGAIDLGMILYYGRRVELGVNYSILIGSENVPGTADVTLGFNF